MFFMFRTFWIRFIKKASHKRYEAGLSVSYKLDEIDLRIISSLTKDSRKTVTKIAKMARISRPTAIARLERLRKNNVVHISARVNITKLGFKFALVALKTKSAESRRNTLTKLAVCPRVLTLLQTSGTQNYYAILYGENTETLLSVIESFKTFSSMEVVSWNRAKPLLPETFDLKVFLEKRKHAPCGKKCGECSSYQNNECFGCLAVTEYTGPL